MILESYLIGMASVLLIETVFPQPGRMWSFGAAVLILLLTFVLRFVPA